MILDSFENSVDSLIAPARLVFSIQPSDSEDLPRTTKALYVGSGGDVALKAVDSETDVVLRNVVSGTVLAVRIDAIRETGTTASDLVGLA